MLRKSVFVCGSSWSGSGAVTDWLRNSSDFMKFPGQEIKVFSQGILALEALSASGSCLGFKRSSRALFGRSLGECPFVKGGAHRLASSLADSFLTQVYDFSKHLLRGQSVDVYGRKLSEMLRAWPEDDATYLACIESILGKIYESRGRGVLDLSCQGGGLIRHINDIWSKEGIPLFDNAFPRATISQISRFLDGIDRSVVFVVYRDFLDQYAEIRQARFLPLIRMKDFSREYNHFFDSVDLAVESAHSGSLVCPVSFESFVSDPDYRQGLDAMVRKHLDVVNSLEPANGPFFDPRESIGNIGKYKKILSRRQVSYLSSRCHRSR